MYIVEKEGKYSKVYEKDYRYFTERDEYSFREVVSVASRGHGHDFRRSPKHEPRLSITDVEFGYFWNVCRTTSRFVLGDFAIHSYSTSVHLKETIGDMEWWSKNPSR